MNTGEILFENGDVQKRYPPLNYFLVSTITISAVNMWIMTDITR